MTQGICRNPKCSNGVMQTPVERYEGPGEFCPECGDRLEALSAGAPFGGLSALEALQRLDVEVPPQVKLPRRMRAFLAAGAVVAAAVISLAIFRPIAIGHPSGDAIRICSSSMSERLARGVIQGYAAKSGAPASQFVLSRLSPCDVRFSASVDGNRADAIGYDGVVVVVNPANPVMHLDDETVRRVFAGEITDWSQAGGPRGSIVAMLPDRGSDETDAPIKGLLRGARLSPSVRRLPSSADVTRAVVRADSRGAIGLVAFSESIPAKVLTLGTSPAPSPLSIGDRRYPLSLGITVSTDGAAHVPAAALVQYARSDEAQAVVLRSGLVPKKGI